MTMSFVRRVPVISLCHTSPPHKLVWCCMARGCRYERKSRREGGNTSTDSNDGGSLAFVDRFEPDPSKPHRWWSAFIPIFSVVLTVILTLVFTGISACNDKGLPLCVRWTQRQEKWRLTARTFTACWLSDHCLASLNTCRSVPAFPWLPIPVFCLRDCLSLACLPPFLVPWGLSGVEFPCTFVCHTY